MKIRVHFAPSCIWVLEGDTFFCTHNETIIVDTSYMIMTYDGPDEVESQGYTCAECGEPLEGSPAEDRADYLAELEADRSRDE